jgi:rsbT antagonist protein RsbS
MSRVSIIKIGHVLIANIQEDLSDSDALEFQEDLNTAIEQHDVAGVLLDLSLLGSIDSFLGRLLNDLAAGSRLLGAETIVVGMRPAVAITLVEMGLQLSGVRTALTAEVGMRRLRSKLEGR